MKHNQDFKNFVNAEKSEAPSYLKDAVLKQVSSKLNPAFTQIFFKIALIQLVSGLVILSFCPQLGVGFSGHNAFVHLLMSFGENFCNLFCGSLFIGIGSFHSAIILNEDELRVLRRRRFLGTTLISLLSLLAFVIFGAEIQLLFFAFWLSGAMIIGLFSLEVVYMGRAYAQKNL